jgi:hypothetical protein
MKKRRFSLRGVMLVMTAIALLLGFSQYSRREALAVCAVLRKDGANLTIDDRWLWIQKPATAEVRVVEWPDHRLTLGGRTILGENLQNECEALEKRLYEYGVDEVYLSSEVHFENGEVWVETLCFED